MTFQPGPERTRAGQEWLLSCAGTPAETRRLWDADELGSFPTGGHWTVAETSLTRTMAAIKRVTAGRRGPVLADTTREIAWWLLPPSLTDELDDIHTVTVHPRGWVLRCPPVLYPVRGRVWIDRPDGSGRLTDPLLLGSALRPGHSPRLSAEGFR